MGIKNHCKNRLQLIGEQLLEEKKAEIIYFEKDRPYTEKRGNADRTLEKKIFFSICLGFLNASKTIIKCIFSVLLLFFFFGWFVLENFL